MGWKETLENGDTVFCAKMPEHIAELPSVIHWKKFVADRGLYMTTYTQRGVQGSKQNNAIKGTEQIARVENGQVVINCVACGIAVVGNHLGMRRIQIGTLVRMSYLDRISATEYVKKWRRVPVQLSGLGCRDCQVLMDCEQELVNIENKRREELGKLMAEIALQNGKTVRLPEPLKAYIEVGELVRAVQLPKEVTND